MPEIGRKEFISVVPEAVAVLSNIAEPFLEKFPVQLITSLGLRDEAFGLFDADV